MHLPDSNGGLASAGQPMLATAVTTLPTGPGWAFEFKWDGYRVLLDVSERGVTLHSRTGNDLTARFPEVTALGADVGDGLFDGELVVLVNGRPSFEALQQHSISEQSAPATFIAFDLLRRYGVDLTARPYVERRATLDRWVLAHPEWTLSPFFDDGPATEAAAREHGIEGVVAKRLASTYRSGVRSPDWQKLKFVHTGDYVVIGWEAAAERPGVLSSLLLGRATDDGFVFAGKAGSGLDARTSSALQTRLHARPTPAVDVPATARGRSVQWVEPLVVVEVQFTERTESGVLRHPVFLRVRDDKSAAEAGGE
ncbi:MAG TPA: non-homologous end-joining DNA ligase [Jatrophihabitans sp.]